jgi:hypothetical protein
MPLFCHPLTITTKDPDTPSSPFQTTKGLGTDTTPAKPQLTDILKPNITKTGK